MQARKVFDDKGVRVAAAAQASAGNRAERLESPAIAR
jgi:hypothetical protein